MAHWFDKIAKGFVITWATLVSFVFPQLDTKQSPVPLLPVPPLETPRATATRTDTSEKTQSDTATTSTETTTTLTHTLPEKEPATESYVPEKIENPADEKSNLEIDRAPVIPQNLGVTSTPIASRPSLISFARAILVAYSNPLLAPAL